MGLWARFVNILAATFVFRAGNSSWDEDAYEPYETDAKTPKLKKYGSFVKSAAPLAFSPSLTYAEEAVLEPEKAQERLALQAARRDKLLYIEQKEREEKEAAIQAKLRQVEREQAINSAKRKAENALPHHGSYDDFKNSVRSNPTHYWERRMLSQGETKRESLMAFYHLQNCPQCGSPTKKTLEGQMCKSCDINIVLVGDYRKGTVLEPTIIPREAPLGKNATKRFKKNAAHDTAIMLAAYRQSTCPRCKGYMEVQTTPKHGTHKMCRNCHFEARPIVDVQMNPIDIEVLNVGYALGQSDSDWDKISEELENFFD